MGYGRGRECVSIETQRNGAEQLEGEIQESVCLCVYVYRCVCVYFSIDKQVFGLRDCAPRGLLTMWSVPACRPPPFFSFLSCPRSSTLSYPLSNIALSSVVFGYDGPVA